MDEERRELYYKSREEFLRRQASNDQTRDSAILTLSSAGLVVSLLFVKNVVQLNAVSCSCLLILSWIMFIVAIVSTLVSFFTSQHAIRSAISRINESLRSGQELDNQTSTLDKITIVLSYVSATFYIVAIMFTCVFIALNTN